MTDRGELIDGRAIAQTLQQELFLRVRRLKEAGLTPGLAFVRVGEDPASRTYVGMKEKMCAALGIASRTEVFPAATPGAGLLERIDQLNRESAVHGILVQSPLPGHLRPQEVFARVDPRKDVDGFHPVNMGKLLLGDPTGFVPCTPAAVQQLLSRAGMGIDGRHVVILGRGIIVGKPLAQLLTGKAPDANATVTICHRQTREIEEHCRRADILVAAMGVPQFVRGHMVREGAVVIDVGVNRMPDPDSPKGYRLVGDVHFEEARARASYITPNPGGVGPMTVMMLMHNTVRAAENFLQAR